MDKFKWIRKFWLEHVNTETLKVSDVVPNKFENYYIFHWHIGILDSFPFDKYPFDKRTLKDINEALKIDQIFKDLLNNPKRFNKISLLELSKKFNVKYDHTILNNIPLHPAIMTFDFEGKKTILDFIKNKKENLNLFIGDNFRYFDEDIDQEIENISFEEYKRLQDIFDFDYWTYLFPESLDWCFITAENQLPILAMNTHLNIEVNNLNLEIFKVDNVSNVLI